MPTGHAEILAIYEAVSRRTLPAWQRRSLLTSPMVPVLAHYSPEILREAATRAMAERGFLSLAGWVEHAKRAPVRIEP